jgi:hypothetical protein
MIRNGVAERVCPPVVHIGTRGRISFHCYNHRPVADIPVLVLVTRPPTYAEMMLMANQNLVEANARINSRQMKPLKRLGTH